MYSNLSLALSLSLSLSLFTWREPSPGSSKWVRMTLEKSLSFYLHVCLSVCLSVSLSTYRLQVPWFFILKTPRNKTIDLLLGTSIRLFGVLLHQMFYSVITGPRLDLRPFPATLNDCSHTLPALVRRLVYFPPRQTSQKPEQLLVQTIVEAKSFLFRTTTESVQTESYTNQTWLNLQLRIP